MKPFSDEVERAIVARYLAGESTVVLGRAYETSRHRINRVLTRHNEARRTSEEAAYALQRKAVSNRSRGLAANGRGRHVYPRDWTSLGRAA